MPALLVTHDFAEAALLGDRVGVLDGGRVVQLGPAAELSAAAGVRVRRRLHRRRGADRRRAPGRDGLTSVALDGGGAIVSTDEAERAGRREPLPVGDRARGRQRAVLGAEPPGGEVVSVTEIGGRARVGLQAGQPLVAEVSVAAVRELALVPGARVTATWKAAATRLAPR